MRLKVPGTGIGYDSLDEAIADVGRMEELRDVEVGDLRDAGKEAAADLAADRWNRQIQKTRDAIRGAQEREARTTAQPAGRPKRKPSTRARAGAGTSASPARGGSRRKAARSAWAGRSKRRSGFLSSFGRGSSGKVLRDTGAAGATSSVAKLVLQVFGLIVGLAFVLVVLESESEERSAVGGLADALIRFVGAIVDPVDPFSRSAWQPAEQPAAAAASTSSSLARRPARPTIVRGSA